MNRNIFGYFAGLFALIRMGLSQIGFEEPSVRILIYHHVPNDQDSIFRAHINYVQRYYHIISPRDLEQILAGEKISSQRCILITFDDGYASQGRITREILDPLNIKALFFISLGYLGCKTPDAAMDFQKKSICLTPWDMRDTDSEGRRPMQDDEIRSLISNGHYIGAHTNTHARLSMLNSPQELEDEVCGAGNELAKRFGVPINHFAYPFGNIASIDDRAMTMALNRYRYVYSGIRGDNRAGVRCLYRDAVSLDLSLSYLRLSLEGGLDPRYWKIRKELLAMQSKVYK